VATDVERDESFATILGGRRSAVDSTVPPIAFVAGWLIARQTALDVHAIGIGGAAAVVAAAILGGYRLTKGGKPASVVLSLFGVLVAVLVVLRTGRAADFFLVQIVTNAVSAVAWLLSIVVRRPLLGVVVGFVLGQKTRWRRDPALLRAYSLGSWVWVLQYVIRVAVLTPLWFSGFTVALTVARIALTWPLVAACLAVSWWMVVRALPPGHPGLRRPREE
jgi:hypothetical protein